MSNARRSLLTDFAILLALAAVAAIGYVYSPLLLPNPSGQISVAEFISIQVELNAEAQRNTTLDLNS